MSKPTHTVAGLPLARPRHHQHSDFDDMISLLGWVFWDTLNTPTTLARSLDDTRRLEWPRPTAGLTGTPGSKGGKVAVFWASMFNILTMLVHQQHQAAIVEQADSSLRVLPMDPADARFQVLLRACQIALEEAERVICAEYGGQRVTGLHRFVMNVRRERLDLLLRQRASMPRKLAELGVGKSSLMELQRSLYHGRRMRL